MVCQGSNLLPSSEHLFSRGPVQLTLVVPASCRLQSEETPDVTKDDQRRINAFGRLNTRKQDVQAELSGKKVRLYWDVWTVAPSGEEGVTLTFSSLLCLSRNCWRTWRRRATS